MYRILAAIGMLTLSGLAIGCPNGIPTAGNPGCIPPDRTNSPYYQGGGFNQRAPVGRWETRWGAFVLDQKTGLGISSGMSSKRAAQSEAMNDCRAKGGTRCKVELVYFNQCGVLIEGERGYNTAAADTVEQATSIGMKTCQRADTNCKLYFSECSQAQLVK